MIQQQTYIDSGVAIAKALADTGLWSAEEAATVTALTALDNYFATAHNGAHLPYNQFLKAEAQAHQNWWNTNDGAAYLQWVKDRNGPEETWDKNIRIAHAKEAQQERNDKYNEAFAFANAAYTETTTEAAAADDYITGTSGSATPGLAPHPRYGWPASY